MQSPNLQFWREVLLALFLAIISAFATAVPPFDHFGGISLALIAGMLTKALFWKPNSGSDGLAFAGKTLLRIGIVLLGLRLNFTVLAHSRTQVVVFDLLMIILGITLIVFVLRRVGFEPNLAILAAVGISICGASAIAAAAPAIRANKESSALAIVVCTLIGTIATFLVIPLQSIAGLAPAKYGILVGATLHEVAQVVAAVTPVPDAFQTGMAAKLLRVVFLAPVIAVFALDPSQSIWGRSTRADRVWAKAPIPSLVRGRISADGLGRDTRWLSSARRPHCGQRDNESTNPTDQPANRHFHGGDWSAGRLCPPAETWSEADAYCRDRMVAAIRGDFCALFSLEMTGFAHLSRFGPETILKLNECDIRVASPGAVSDCINSA